MKRTILILFIVMFICPKCFAFGFPVTIPSGQTLYFNTLTSPTPGSVGGVGTVEVVSPRTSYPYYNDSQKPAGDIVIPSMITAYGNNYRVVQVAQHALYSCSNITSVSIPTTVHTIWGSAFGNCTKLKEVIIPDDCAVSIRSSAFSYCDSLTTITLGNMVDTLYSNVFNACNNITTINLNTEHLRNSYAQFANARVKNVNIGPSVKSIPKSLFQNCDSLISITIPDSVTSIKSLAFSGCSNLSNIVLGNQLCRIESGSFSGTAIQKLYLSDKIRHLGSYAFSNCTSLRYVHTGDYIDSIPSYAFSGCINLDTLSTCCTYMENFAFDNCDSIRTIIYNARKKYNSHGSPLFYNRLPNPNAVKSLIIGDSVRTISRYMFGNLGINQLELGSSVEVIEYNAFYNCHNLTSVTLPEHIDTLHEGAFWNDSSLRTVIYRIPRCNIYKPQSSAIDQTPATVFPQCPIDSVFFAENVREIPDGLLRGRNLSFVAFSDSLESIGDYAFEGSGMGVFPSMVSSIGDYAFANCTNLSDTLVIPENIQTIGEGVFSGCNNLAGVSLYNTMTTIPDYCFENCSGMGGQLVLPQSITHIGERAFRNCGVTGRLTIPGSIVNIGDSAFAGCSNLTDTLVIPFVMTTIGDGVFKRCSQIPEVVFHTHLTRIGNEAFMNCSSLRRVYIPKLYTPTNQSISIGKAAFAKCENVTIVDLRRAASIDSYAFAECDNLSVARFNGVAFGSGSYWYFSGNIGNFGARRQFYNCGNLRRIRTTVSNCVDLYPDIFLGCSSFDTLILDTLWARWNSSNGETLGHRLTVLHPCYQSNPDLTGFDNSTQFNIIASPFVDRGFFNAGYDLFSYSSSDTSAGTVSCSSNSCKLIVLATPKPGYVFSEWSDGSKMNPHNAKGVLNATAYFSPAIYLTVSSSDTTKGTAIGSDSVEASSARYISAIPKPGFHFSHWNDGNTNNPRHVQVDYNMQFVAHFAPNDTVIEYVYIHDTNMVSYPVHDTTYIDVPYAVHDTTYINIYVHDTTTIVDTLTEYVHIYDTTYIDVPYAVHDTTIVIDTLTLTEYVPVRDTTYVNIHDTTYIDVPYAVHDTTYVILTDTVINTIYDTVTNTIFDTVTNTVYDTIDNYVHDTLTVTDTLWLTQTDTLWLHDTIIIHDTIYITQEGVDGVEEMNAKVYSSNGQIVVDGAAGNTVWLYDINGRVLATKRDEYTPLRFDAPASGAYLIKIGGHPARKVVVIR